jgi:hypothetical protein
VGSIVKVKRPFGLGDVPVGTKGVVVGEFHKGEPVIRFEGKRYEYSPPKESIEVVSRTSKKPYINIMTLEQFKEKAADLDYKYDIDGKRLYAYRDKTWYDDGGFEHYYDIDLVGSVEGDLVKIHDVSVAKGQFPRSKRYLADEFADQEATEWSH